MDKAQALHSFWSSFGLTAYDGNTIPTGDARPALPYITYEVAEANFDEPVSISGSLWYKSMSWAEITQKAEEINRGIGLGGKVIPYDGGKLWIKRGAPFSRRMSDADDTIRRIYMNIEVEYFTAD